MKIFMTTAALVGAMQLADATHVHMRVHAAGAARWDQCHFEGNKRIECQEGLYCAVQNEYYGQCVDLQPKLWDQCGGKGWPEDVECQEGACSFVNEWYSQCKPAQDQQQQQQHQHARQHHHQKNADDALVGLWGQCKWKDSYATCQDDLQCIVENEWYGQCRPKVVNVWEQCGGKTLFSTWTAGCSNGNECVKTDDYYSQCKPTQAHGRTHGHRRHHQHGVAGVWGQCGGKNYNGPTQCADDATCVRHNDWYSQCKPAQLPVNELCGQDDKRTNVWKYDSCANDATCQQTTATEFRCKN